MIAQIQGKLVEKTPTEVVIDCNGVGYHINISLHTYSLLPKTDFIKLFTHLIIKEDSHSLYGFVEKSEKEIFKMLLTVSGIGAGIARTMLSSLEPKQIIQALASGDVNTIQSIKGIGGKTAQRAILAPIPETESNILNISLSDFSINPYKVCASSRINKCVYNFI